MGRLAGATYEGLGIASDASTSDGPSLILSLASSGTALSTCLPIVAVQLMWRNPSGALSPTWTNMGRMGRRLAVSNVMEIW